MKVRRVFRILLVLFTGLAMVTLVGCSGPKMEAKYTAQIESWVNVICPEGYDMQDASSQPFGGRTAEMVYVYCKVVIPESRKNDLVSYFDRAEKVFSQAGVLQKTDRSYEGGYPMSDYILSLDGQIFRVGMGYGSESKELKPYIVFSTTGGAN